VREGQNGETWRLTAGQVLFVGKDEEQAVLHFSVAENAVKLLAGFVDALTVARIDDENEALRARIVMSPKRTNLVLTADIPNIEFHLGNRTGPSRRWKESCGKVASHSYMSRSRH